MEDVEIWERGGRPGWTQPKCDVIFHVLIGFKFECVVKSFR